MTDTKEKQYDDVNTPKRYAQYGDLEPIQVIEYFNLDFRLGNVLKYIVRHKEKDSIRSLRSAIWYIARYLYTTYGVEVGEIDPRKPLDATLGLLPKGGKAE